jgi:hypothetical protein
MKEAPALDIDMCRNRDDERTRKVQQRKGRYEVLMREASIKV